MRKRIRYDTTSESMPWSIDLGSFLRFVWPTSHQSVFCCQSLNHRIGGGGPLKSQNNFPQKLQFSWIIFTVNIFWRVLAKKHSNRTGFVFSSSFSDRVPWIATRWTRTRFGNEIGLQTQRVTLFWSQILSQWRKVLCTQSYCYYQPQIHFLLRGQTPVRWRPVLSPVLIVAQTSGRRGWLVRRLLFCTSRGFRGRAGSESSLRICLGRSENLWFSTVK